MIEDSIKSLSFTYYHSIGNVLAASAFSIFFGGTILDALVAGLIGFILFLADKFLKIQDTNKLIHTLIMCTISGLIAISCICMAINFGNNLNKIIIGVAMIFNVPKDKPAYVSISGLISWISYLIMFKYTDNLFTCCFVASVLICFYSEIMARVLKAPSNTFLIPSTIPLLPGGAFYYTFDAILNYDIVTFQSKGIETRLCVLGITTGIVIGYFIFQQIIKIKKVKNLFA